MQTMPTQTTPTYDIPSVEIPAIPMTEWNTLVRAWIGRPVTPQEEQRIEQMARHNWTARVVAEDILGRDLTTEEVMDQINKT